MRLPEKAHAEFDAADALKFRQILLQTRYAIFSNALRDVYTLRTNMAACRAR